jgi:PAS domain S-box-containing protein
VAAISLHVDMEENIKAVDERLNEAQQLAKMGSWEWIIADNQIFWSDELYRIFDIDRNDFIANYEGYLCFLHPEDKERVNAIVASCLETYEPFSYECRIITGNGTNKMIYAKGRAILNEKNELVKMQGIAQDITENKQKEKELKKLNDELKKKAEELAASNRELEQFAYIASHDLQEPLRMVSSFLQLLEKKYKDQLDTAAQQYIDYAVNGADRMKILILDLLQYSRVSTNKEISTETDTREVVSQVLNDLSQKISESNAIIEVGKLPVIIANTTQLTQLFQNLIGNGLKYNTSEVPKMEIGCERKGNYWQFHIRDNGIGIDPKFYQRIFIIFQRLHNKSQFSGTGIGLAICKKIVDRHGGKIWVESQPEQGSVFYFTLPA